MSTAIALILTPQVSSARTASRIEPGIIGLADDLDLLARFDDTTPVALDRIAGLEVRYRFGSTPAVLVHATPAAVRALASLPSLVYLERDKPIAFDMDTATVASRAREVWDGPDPIEIDGDLVDGDGVGIAIVDTGLDGLHPDFEGRVDGLYEITPAGAVEVPAYNSHPQDAHGTHVAGIAAASGAVSDGRFVGVAPSSSVYAFQMFTGTVGMASIAFDWILQHGAEQDPPIRIVNNSWHCTTYACQETFDPDMLHYQLASQLAESGIVVTWSAGNQYGDGDLPTTNPEATNQTPGIIGVANYNDGDTGTRDNCISKSSGWGDSADPTTWPDVAAPGHLITSTWALGPYATQSGPPIGRNPVTDGDAYHVASGTSMSAPHVAGIAALMLEANPDLTPAEVEYIIKQTATALTTSPPPPNQFGCDIAYPKADPSHPWNGSNFVAGHGLVDARAAVEAAIAFTTMPPMPAVEPLPPGFVLSRKVVRHDQVWYLTGEDALAAGYPDASIPRVRAFQPDDVVTHTSPPLSDAITFDGMAVDVYLGTTAEAGDAFSLIGRTQLYAEALRVTPDGNETILADMGMRNLAVRTLGPNHRKFRGFLDAPVTLEAGDRLRVRLWLEATPYQGVQPALNGFWDLFTESFTPSRITIGAAVTRPVEGSRLDCERRRDCAMVDATHPYEGLRCEEEIPFRLTWTGPPGSALLYNCDGLVFTCEIVGEPGGPDQQCTRDVTVTTNTDDTAAFCTYRMPDGSRGGSGACRALITTDGA